METITSRENAKIKYACAVRDSEKQRAADGLFFAEGPKLCLELAKSCTPRAMYATAAALAKTPELAQFDPAEIAPHVAEKLSGTKSNQGVFALFETPVPPADTLDTARRTILAQYEKRPQLFPGKDVLPELACLTVIQAVQGLGGQDTGYADWFDALTEMERRMDAADYDVAIVGAGAYSLPLAAHARDTGHAAIQMSGATQLLFGIKGKRWDDHPVISKLYNPAWVRPDETEGISNKEKVEGGSYW